MLACTKLNANTFSDDYDEMPNAYGVREKINGHNGINNGVTTGTNGTTAVNPV